MINLDAFIQALKSTWIRRLLITGNKRQVFIKTHVDIKKLTNCNMIFIGKNNWDFKKLRKQNRMFKMIKVQFIGIIPTPSPNRIHFPMYVLLNMYKAVVFCKMKSVN